MKQIKKPEQILPEKVLVEPVDREEKTAGGLLIPPEQRNNNQGKARIVLLGKGVQEDFKNHGLEWKEGDIIIYAKRSEVKLDIDNHQYFLLDKIDLLFNTMEK